MQRVKDGDNQVSILTVASILELLLLALLLSLNVSCESFLVSTVHLLSYFNEVIVIVAESLHFRECGVSNFSVLFKLLRAIQGLSRQRLPLSILLGFSSLCEEHFPFPYVIHSLVLVRNEISFNERTVFHEYTLPVGLFLIPRFPFALMKINQYRIWSLA
jgi:hypothetical protein